MVALYSKWNLPKTKRLSGVGNWKCYNLLLQRDSDSWQTFPQRARTVGNCHRVAKFESTLGTAQQSVEFMNEHCSAAAGCQKKKVELELHLQHNCSRCLSLVLPFYFCLVEHDVPTCKIQIKLAGLVSIVAFWRKPRLSTTVGFWFIVCEIGRNKAVNLWFFEEIKIKRLIAI